MIDEQINTRATRIAGNNNNFQRDDAKAVEPVLCKRKRFVF